MSASLRLLHTNDLHGALTEELAELLASMRGEHDLLFDTGDCIKTGNLGIPMKPERVWPLLAHAGCAAGTIGNRETHLLESAFQAKLKGAAHPLLCANLRHRLVPPLPSARGVRGEEPHTARIGEDSSLQPLSPRRRGASPLPASLILDHAGIRLGLIGVSVPMVTEGMRTKFASAYLWDPPIPAAIREAKRLRPDVDVLIALTHIGHKRDLQLAEACPEMDIILGGHSHTVLESPEKHGGTWICQGGSHARFVGVYEWEMSTRRLSGGLRPLKSPS